MTETHAVIFDIDGTLSPEISWYSLTRDLGASVERHRDIFNKFLDNRSTYTEAKNALLELWQSTGNANHSFIEKLFLNLPLREGGENVIGYLRSKKLTVCLITGSVDLYANVIARRLGVPFFFANATLFWNKDGALADLEYERNQGEKKLRQFLMFCKEQNINPLACAVVGDGENDKKLFEFTKKGILLKSDSAISIQYPAWKTIKNLSELKSIF